MLLINYNFLKKLGQGVRELTDSLFIHLDESRKRKKGSKLDTIKSGSGFPPDRFVLDTFVSVDIHSSTELIQCGRPCVESPPDYFSIMALGFSES